jgi:excisionase family DNA binding protein
MYSNLKYCLVRRNLEDKGAPSMERLLTSDEVAEYLRVDVVTIRRLINRGELTAYRIGGEYRFKLSDIEKYLQRQRVSGEVEEVSASNQLTIPQLVKALQGRFAASGPADRNRFDKFTDRARRVLALAQEEARRFQHNYLGTEHLLLGLVREGEGVAAKVLNSLGVEQEKVREAVEFIIGRGDHVVVGEVGLTPRAKKVIELAVDEARRFNHHYIGTEHLLLGLVREGSGVAAGVLESLGVRLERLRTETIHVLSDVQENAPQAASPSEPPESPVPAAEGEQELTCSHCGTGCPGHYIYCFNCGQRLASE